ncbi:hypothetical protein GBA63_22305 (plasmid) [Rubrobacter tropicus]|uniref:Uncharacterized protein n=1 Tax=Rubrobacter tropicus TaxID=2653851 RepID=A0A6G8QFZ3_9ACTN|nr:hypothetical protein [Rubrobacter tropicus]QIN85436.1 hypothetical protein GBA63_22305 [Rubrobacter tropicus]
MWVEDLALLGEGETLAAAMLKDEIPLRENGARLVSTVVERVSGVFCARLPVRSRGVGKRLIVVAPGATQSLGRYLAVSLLLADLVHREGSRVAEGERGPLVRGDLLLVTQRIRRCAELLRALRVGSLALSDYWQMEVLSKYSPSPRGTRPRVYVANPGWKPPSGGTRAFGCVIIDATHPRTAAHLEELLEHPTVRSARAQVVIVPPWEEGRLAALREAEGTDHGCWAWDPAAVSAVAGRLSAESEPVEGGSVPAEPPERTIHVWEDEPVNEALLRAHEVLAGAVRVGGVGAWVPALREGWSIYHRLRQLAVPLIQAEEQRRLTYGTVTLARRLALLEEDRPTAAGRLGAYLDVSWPVLIRALKDAYDLLIRRSEPVKFWAAASLIEGHLEGRVRGSYGGLLRVVAPTEHEGNLLASLLGEVVDGWSEALQDGLVSLSTARGEPRLIAEGERAETVLLGYRTGENRYLDVYPGVPVHVLAYPYEAVIDAANQGRAHAPIERLQDDGVRSAMLREMAPPSGREPARPAGSNGRTTLRDAPFSPRARIVRRAEGGGKTRLVRPAEPDAVEALDLGDLSTDQFSWADETVVGVPSRSASPGEPRTPDARLVEVLDEEGERVVYGERHLVDVYYPATERFDRTAANDLRPGMLVVALVDDRYDDLFQRLVEAMRDERGLEVPLILDLWRRAKQAALAKHGGNRRRLYRELAGRGLSVNYEAVAGYYASGANEALAPDRYEDFELLARASAMYADTGGMRLAFAGIQAERRARRRWGRRLHGVLRRLAGGANYEAALESADALGTPVEEVVAAVSLREVRAVRRLDDGPPDAARGRSSKDQPTLF